MWRALLVVGLLPVLAALIARQVARGRSKEEGSRTLKGAPPAQELAALVLEAGGLEGTVKAGPTVLPSLRGALRLPADCVGGRDAQSLGVAVQEAGLRLLAKRDSEQVDMRMRVLRFGAVGPAFALMVSVFAGIAMRAYLGWIIGGVVLIAGLASVMQLLTTGVELRAAAFGMAALRKSKLPIHASDLDRIEEAALAAAWRRALPGSLAWFLP